MGLSPGRAVLGQENHSQRAAGGMAALGFRGIKGLGGKTKSKVNLGEMPGEQKWKDLEDSHEGQKQNRGRLEERNRQWF